MYHCHRCCLLCSVLFYTLQPPSPAPAVTPLVPHTHPAYCIDYCDSQTQGRSNRDPHPFLRSLIAPIHLIPETVASSRLLASLREEQKPGQSPSTLPLHPCSRSSPYIHLSCPILATLLASHHLPFTTLAQSIKLSADASLLPSPKFMTPHSRRIRKVPYVPAIPQHAQLHYSPPALLYSQSNHLANLPRSHGTLKHSPAFPATWGCLARTSPATVPNAGRTPRACYGLAGIHPACPKYPSTQH